jgi:serine/threonine-protein kinase
MRRDHRDASQRLEALRRLLDSGAMPAHSSGTQRLDTASFVAGLPAELRPGVTLAGRYRLLGELGRGGMGRVYKAEDQELGGVVAIKTLHGAALDAADQDRLLREVQISRRITHPNVVRVYDIGRFPGGLFVSMEYLEGQTLDQHLRERGQLPLSEARDLLIQLLGGLQEAHQLRIVHRDLKPSNVVLTGDRLKILDFGIARMEGGDGSLTMPGEVLGSPKYMSPEQIQGEELDGRTDLYSLGILAYAMVTGREPFTGSSASAIALKQLREPPPDPAELRPGLPEPWQALLSRLLAKTPQERYASAAEALAVVRLLPV